MINKSMNLMGKEIISMKNMTNMGSRFREARQKQEEQGMDIKRIWIFLFVTFALTYAVEIFMIMPLAGSADEQSALIAQLLKAGAVGWGSSSAVIALQTSLIRSSPWQNALTVIFLLLT